MTRLVLDGFGGPGGWDEALRALGLRSVGIEKDAAACATRAAAGHLTIRADMSAFPAAGLAGKTWGQCHSPPCIVWSNAGQRAGVAVVAILAEGVRDQFAGRPTRAKRRREIATALRLSGWPRRGPAPQYSAEGWRLESQQAWKRKLLARKGSPRKRLRDMVNAPPGWHLTRAQRSAKIWDAARSASLVLEPARFIHAGQPEWVALEQVPAVLPLWKVYAEELGRQGYSTWCGTLNAADYGVPQTRERAILIASRVRRVHRPEPTHYSPRKGDQLWGTPWVSMAQALGWGATGRAAPTVTAGGTATGGAEPFGHRDRDALAAERETGRWVLRTSFGKPAAGPKSTGTGSHGTHEMDPAARPSHVVTTKAKDWVLQGPYRDSPGDRTRPRTMDEPATTIAFGHSSIGPAQDHAGVTEGDRDPAWVNARPATTVLGDPRIGRPGHKGRECGGESHFATDSVRITVREAAILQSFRPDYPWQGTRTKQFQQVGNAFCPLAAIAVLGVATGTDWQPIAERYSATFREAMAA